MLKRKHPRPAAIACANRMHVGDLEAIGQFDPLVGGHQHRAPHYAHIVVVDEYAITYAHVLDLLFGAVGPFNTDNRLRHIHRRNLDCSRRKSSPSGEALDNSCWLD